MSEINIARQLLAARHEKKITQDELAAYIGVSKAAVSKWESGNSFPDITLLPRLATYFNISIDKLMGYEPQMTKEEIKKTYHELKKLFVEKSWEEAFEVCQSFEHKYYSCFPFLLQLVVLYINHASLCKNEPKKIYEHCTNLAERIRTLSEDVNDVKEATTLEAACFLLLKEPIKALDLMDEQVRPLPQDTEMLGQIYQSMGNVDRAMDVYQIAMYQHLLYMIGNAMPLLLLYANDLSRVDEILHRILQVMETFQIDNLHPNTAAGVYLTAAQVYCMHQETDKSIDMLDHYVFLCETCFFPFTLHGDEFFDRISPWFQEFDLGEKAPRSEALIRKSMLDAVQNSPLFEPLKDKKEYKSLIKRLKKVSEMA